MDYSYLKLIHLFAVMLFLGNIVTGLFWMRIAVKTKDLKIISFTMKGIITADKYFTIPGVLVITAGGLLLFMGTSQFCILDGFSGQSSCFQSQDLPLHLKLSRYKRKSTIFL